jgi:hypothetical protein
MKRALVGLAVAATAVTLLVSAGAASAATGQVFKLKAVGPTAGGLWISSTATSATVTFISASQDQLAVIQITDNADSSGNIIGGTETIANVTSGFSFAIDKGQLSSASTSGSGIPATTCALDANLNQISCAPTTLDLAVAWTGVGPSEHQILNQRLLEGIVRESSHTNGIVRSATATGTLSGTPLSGLADGALAFASETDTTLCVDC